MLRALWSLVHVEIVDGRPCMGRAVSRSALPGRRFSTAGRPRPPPPKFRPPPARSSGAFRRHPGGCAGAPDPAARRASEPATPDVAVRAPGGHTPSGVATPTAISPVIIEESDCRRARASARPDPESLTPRPAGAAAAGERRAGAQPGRGGLLRARGGDGAGAWPEGRRNPAGAREHRE